MISRYIKLSMLLLLAAGCEKETPAVGNDADGRNSVVAESNDTVVKAEGVSDAQISDIVKKVMDEQYGKSFNEKNQCWDYVASNLDDKQYCMRPGKAKLVDGNTGKSVYFYASSRADIADDPAYSYSSVDPGLLGAFKLSIEASGTWRPAASNKAMEFGSIGNCGCDRANFVKLGAGDFYGWTFSSGGTWQGITVLNHAIVAPQGGGFANISSIPEIWEDDQDTTYQIKVMDSDASKKVFPVLVLKQAKGQAAQELVVPFDEDKKLYALPENF